jgi:hypothetical protein
MGDTCRAFRGDLPRNAGFFQLLPLYCSFLAQCKEIFLPLQRQTLIYFNMKKVLLLLSLFLMGITASAQESVLSYSEIIQSEGMSALDLYKNARNWMARTYGSSKEVIEYDQVGEEITGNGIIPFTVNNMTWSFTSGRIRYVVNMKFRDGRYKVTVENFQHESMDLKFPKTKSAGLLYKAVNEAEIDGWTKGPFEKKSFRRLYKEVYKRAMPLCEAEAKKIFEGLKSFSETKKEEDDW